MNHLKAGRKLNRTASHRRALLCNMASSLFEHKKITTTEAKAKELRPFAEDLISKAKRAIVRERQGQLADGRKIDVHSRRMVGRDIHSKAVVQELFDTIAPALIDRPGGYTRVIKLGQRKGDGSPEAIIELVDWSAPQDGATTKRKKQVRKTAPKAKTTKASETRAQVGDATANESQTPASADETAPTAANHTEENNTDLGHQNDDTQTGTNSEQDSQTDENRASEQA